MRLRIQEDPSANDIDVLIVCPKVDSRVRRIIEAAEEEASSVSGICDGFLFSLDSDEILYIETVDGKTFLYAREKVLESMLCLAALEAELAGTEFVRASRQMLVNLRHVKGLRPSMNARLELVLDNNEHVIASRQYAPAIKKRIGL